MTNEWVTLVVVAQSPCCCNRISEQEAWCRIIMKRIKTCVYLPEGTVLYFGPLQYRGSLS